MKSRREKIECTSSVAMGDEVFAMLDKNLHARANLKRSEENGRAIFTFYPTKGEYFVIAMTLLGMSEAAKNQLKT